MREIKFRARNRYSNEFAKVREKYADEVLMNLDGQVEIWACDEGGCDLHTDTDGQYILMQFTGLKDKNGKGGYFEDLVKWGYSIYQIMWNYEEGVAQLIKLSGGEAWARLPIKELTSGEIIGNVWENPELLEA